MTGTEIRNLREALGLAPSAFASVLGVNPSTLYRWEAASERSVNLDPNAGRVLALLKQKLDAQRQQQAAEQADPGAAIGAAIGTAVLLGGGAFALYKLLEWIFSDAPGKKPSGRGGGMTQT